MPGRTPDPEALNRLLLLHYTLSGTREIERICQAVSHTLESVPGIDAVSICLLGQTIDSKPPFRAQGTPCCLEQLAGTAPFESTPVDCTYATQHHLIRTIKRTYGCLLVQLDSTDNATPYLPYVDNLTNLIALHLENEHQTEQLSTLNEKLTIRYRERSEMLRKTQVERELFFTHSLDMLAISDFEAVLLDINPAWTRILGWDEGELLEEPWTQLLHPEDRAEAMQLWRAITEGLPATEHLCRLRCNNGTYRTFAWNATAIEQSERVFLFARDISNQLQSEQQIKNSEERYRRIFEDSPISLWHEDFSAAKQHIDRLSSQGIVDIGRYLDAHPESVAEMLADIRVLDVNRSSVQLYRATGKAELMASLDKTFTEESLAVFKQELVAIARGDTFFNAEAVTRDLEGRRLDVQILIALPDPASRFESVHVAIVDITGEKQIEASLHVSEQRFRAFAESAADWFWETGPDNRFTYASGRINEVMGISPESVVGYTRDELHRIDENGSAADWETLRSLTEKRSEIVDFPIEWKKPNGDLRHLEISGRPFFDTTGTFQGYRGTGRDVSEEKQTELELEQRVVERTAKLQEANEKLRQLDHLKSMFIASMSHELRTPLNSIIGFSGVLLREIPGPINAKQHDHLQRVKRSGQHLLALISDVIDVSKLEAGKIEPCFASFSLRELIAEALGAMHPEIEKKGLTVITNEPPVGGIVSDRKRLLQCLLNYLAKAATCPSQNASVVSAG